MTHESLHKELLSTIECSISQLFVGTYKESQLLSAMQYSSLNGGKRIRPLLTIATGAMFNVDTQTLVQIGSAIELIHCYSLIHDDLPAMDNDELRRGKATCHIKFNEATAILAGDALQSLAFESLSGNHLNLNAQTKLKIINLLAQSSGVIGMAGGQALDLLNTGHFISQVELQQMHNMKTGALIKCSMLSGYIASSEFNVTVYDTLGAIATKIGLLFQVIDDIIDITSSTESLGKTAHKDLDTNKATYVTILGLENAQEYANTLYLEVKSALKKNFNAEFLLYLVDLVYNRNK